MIALVYQHNRYELMVERKAIQLKGENAKFYLHEHDEAKAESCFCRRHDTHDVF